MLWLWKVVQSSKRNIKGKLEGVIYEKCERLMEVQNLKMYSSMILNNIEHLFCISCKDPGLAQVKLAVSVLVKHWYVKISLVSYTVIADKSDSYTNELKSYYFRQ